MSLGSSGTVYATADQPIVDSQERLAAFCSSTGAWLPLLCTMNCTLATELTRALFETELGELESLISRAEIGAGGVLTLPFFNGERTPNLPNAKGSVFGLDAQNYSKENLLRSALEGATYGLKLGVDALKESGVTPKEIRLIGGGSKSETWCQMVADICDLKVVLLEVEEGAAFGAALQAYQTLLAHESLDSNIAKICKEHVKLTDGRAYLPVSDNVTAYRHHYGQYKRSVGTVSTFY